MLQNERKQREEYLSQNGDNDERVTKFWYDSTLQDNDNHTYDDDTDSENELGGGINDTFGICIPGVAEV